MKEWMELRGRKFSRVVEANCLFTKLGMSVRPFTSPRTHTTTAHWATMYTSSHNLTPAAVLGPTISVEKSIYYLPLEKWMRNIHRNCLSFPSTRASMGLLRPVSIPWLERGVFWERRMGWLPCVGNHNSSRDIIFSEAGHNVVWNYSSAFICIQQFFVPL